MSEQEFLAQYLPAAEKLERFYSHLTLEAVVTRSNMQSMRPVVARQRFVVRTAGDKMRRDRFVPEAAGGESAYIGVKSADGSFVVRRKAGQERFVLSNLSSNSLRGPNILATEHHYLFAPFSENGGFLLANKFRSKSLRITSIEEEERNGEQLVKVTYERSTRFNGQPIHYVGYDVFSKTLGWALRESVAGGGEVQNRGKIEYDGMVDGVPLLKSAEYWRQKGDERYNILRCEVTRIEPGTAPPEAFELAALVGDVRQEKKSPYWLLLIIGGVALVAIAVVLARFAAHRRAPG